MGQIHFTACFVNIVLLAHRYTYLFTCCLWLFCAIMAELWHILYIHKAWPPYKKNLLSSGKLLSIYPSSSVMWWLAWSSVWKRGACIKGLKDLGPALTRWGICGKSLRYFETFPSSINGHWKQCLLPGECAHCWTLLLPLSFSGGGSQEAGERGHCSWHLQWLGVWK